MLDAVCFYLHRKMTVLMCGGLSGECDTRNTRKVQGFGFLGLQVSFVLSFGHATV